jgi:hypothetical protein
MNASLSISILSSNNLDGTIPLKTASAANPLPPAGAIPRSYAPLLIIGVSGMIAYFWFVNPDQRPRENLVLASLTVAAGCLPMVRFLRGGKTVQIPAFEMQCLFLACCFGFPGFLRTPRVDATFRLTVSDAAMADAMQCSLLGILCLQAAYYISRKWFRNVRPWTPNYGLRQKEMESLGWSLFAAGWVVSTGSRLIQITVLSQITGYAANLGFFLLVTLAVEKKVSLRSRLLIYGFLMPYICVYSSGLRNGQLAGVAFFAVWVSLILMRARGRIAWPLIVAPMVLFLVFQPVKFYVRSMSWGQHKQLSLLETFEAYSTGFLKYYGSFEAFQKNAGENAENSFTRINHLVTTAVVIDATPTRVPFSYGRSYLPLLAKPIPRFLWPGKPEERSGNEWAHAYGLLGRDDLSTSYNLPWLTEMYMNFGWSGVVAIMFMLGVIYRWLWQRFMVSPQSSLQYVVGLAIASGLVFAESNLSIMLGGTIQFLIFLWAMGQFLIALLPKE